MLERLLTERGYLELEAEPTPMQKMSREAYGGTRSFADYSSQRQEAALDVLTQVGNIVTSRCDGRWNTARWADVWEDLSDEHGPLMQRGFEATTPAAFSSAFKRLFQMLEVGVETMEELKGRKKLNKQRQVMARGVVARKAVINVARAAVRNSHPRSVI